MTHAKMIATVLCVFGFGLVIACAPAAQPTSVPSTAAPVRPTDATMMAMETDTAMMARETEAAMMAKETDTAMMAKGTDTAMMAQASDAAMKAKPTDAMSSDEAMMPKFPPQQFAAHFVDSTPMHEATLTEAPKLLTLNFNFTLSPASTITIERDGQVLSNAPGKLDDKKLAMTTELPAHAGMGLYLVKYKACWPDNSCHNGQFAFYVK